MRLSEYKSKALFQRYGIKTPNGVVITKSDFLSNKQNYTVFSAPAAVKAQNMIGGRGKAGGIRICTTEEDIKSNISDLFENGFSGNVVDEVLVEDQILINKETYLSISVNRRAGNFSLMASASGGVEIESMDSSHMRSVEISNLVGLQKYQTLYIAKQLAVAGAKIEEAKTLIDRLYKLLKGENALLAEINPLVVLPDGCLLAADAKIIIDDNSLKKSEKDVTSTQQRSPLQIAAEELGVNMVELDGEIAVISNGAGEGMTTLDQIVKAGGKLSLWVDLGGGALSAKPAILDNFIVEVMNTRPKVLLFTAFFQIGRCDLFAESFKKIYMKRKREPDGYIPQIILRLDGRNAAQAKVFSEGTDMSILESSQEACEMAVRLSIGDV